MSSAAAALVRNDYAKKVRNGAFNHNPCFNCIKDVKLNKDLTKLCQLGPEKPIKGITAKCAGCLDDRNADCFQLPPARKDEWDTINAQIQAEYANPVVNADNRKKLRSKVLLFASSIELELGNSVRGPEGLTLHQGTRE
ncbi:unnamed protein product [Zymoseptoria tritici ST99CH_1A5]|uniref:Uncharacterized protein n=1 Tax=Zymoseptoria tritici ST99CH_1A5 TaxID=1276529 RepID=A0A1Y6LUJ0_ZYMTR|nr:unnamed protein product [Zymoseptoria tritici ST99CH_1A5]